VRILVIRPGALGDVLLTLPALRALQARFPQVEIDVMGNLEVVRLLPGRSVVRCAISFDEAELARLFVPDTRPGRGLQKQLDRYELIVSYATPPEHAFARNLTAWARGRVISFDARPSAFGSAHASEHLQGPLEHLGARRDAGPPRLQLSDADRQAAAQWLAAHNVDMRRVAAIHAGSGSAAKNWPAERFVALAHVLIERHKLHVVWLAGPADEQVVACVQEAWGDAAIVWMRDAPLPLVAAVLERCVLYAGNDSGVSHLAAAVGAPGVVVFGPTEPAIWAPRGALVSVVRGETSCAPCNSEQRRVCARTRCFDAVTAATVVAAAAELLQRAPCP